LSLASSASTSANRHTGDDIVSDPDVVETDGYEAGRIKLGGIGCRSDVVQIDAAQIENKVGAFDELPRFRLRRGAGIHAGKLGVALVDDALFHERCGERTAQRFDRLPQLFLQAKPQNCEGRKHDDGLRLADTLGDDRHGLLQRRLV